MLKAFETKEFARLARRAKVPDEALCAAIARVERGLLDADLGSGVIKQRIARANEGRSGGFRAIIIHQQGRRAVFAYLFAKKDKENLTPVEEDVYLDLAKILSEVSDATLDEAVAKKGWKRVDYETYKKKISERAASSGTSRGTGSSRTRRGR